jgi:phosphatidate cytidylyltransferase
VLWKRLLAALVLVPLLAGVILFGSGWPFTLTIALVAGLCAREYHRMFFSGFRDRWGGTALAVLAYGAVALLPPAAALPALLGVVLLATLHFLPGGRTPEEKAKGAGLFVLGTVYIGAFLSCYPKLIALPSGPHWILLGLVAVAGNDTAAYFAGRAFGRTPLAPRLSPKKTVEGAIGGMAASLALGTAYAVRFLPEVPWWYAVGVSGMAGAVGMAGDLFESLLKRAAGVKDSGAIIPGHGGMFDRADSLVAVAPVLYLLALLLPWAACGR